MGLHAEKDHRLNFRLLFGPNDTTCKSARELNTMSRVFHKAGRLKASELVTCFGVVALEGSLLLLFLQTGAPTFKEPVKVRLDNV